MRNIKIICILVFFTGMVLISGCISPAPATPGVPVSSSSPTSDITSRSSGHIGVNYAQPLTVTTNQYPPDPSHWIELHHIQDFRTDPKSGSVRLLFTIAGDTNLPARSLITIEMYNMDLSSGTAVPVSIWNDVEFVEDSGGLVNTFSSTVDLSRDRHGFPLGAGEYGVVVNHQGVNNSTSFEVVGKDPLPRLWIRVDPIGNHHFGDNFTLTGSTNIPAGATILVKGGTDLHPCPFIPPEMQSYYPGSLCGGCSPVDFSDTVPVVSAAGNNTWNDTIRTSTWCLNESTSIRASKDEWDNVSSAHVQLAGSRSEPFQIQTV